MQNKRKWMNEWKLMTIKIVNHVVVLWFITYVFLIDVGVYSRRNIQILPIWKRCRFCRLLGVEKKNEILHLFFSNPRNSCCWKWEWKKQTKTKNQFKFKFKLTFQFSRQSFWIELIWKCIFSTTTTKQNWQKNREKCLDPNSQKNFHHFFVRSEKSMNEKQNKNFVVGPPCNSEIFFWFVCFGCHVICCKSSSLNSGLLKYQKFFVFLI